MAPKRIEPTTSWRAETCANVLWLEGRPPDRTHFSANVQLGESVGVVVGPIWTGSGTGAGGWQPVASYVELARTFGSFLLSFSPFVADRHGWHGSNHDALQIKTSGWVVDGDFVRPESRGNCEGWVTNKSAEREKENRLKTFPTEILGSMPNSESLQIFF